MQPLHLVPQCLSPVVSLPTYAEPKFTGVLGWLHGLPWCEGSVATASLPPSSARWCAPTVLPCRVAVLPPETDPDPGLSRED